MNSQTALRGALASLAIIVLLGGDAVFADYQQTQNPQTLNFVAAGGPSPLPPVGVANSGNQHYNIKGGSLVSAQIGKLNFGPSARFNYTITADVKGQTAQGAGSFQISGRTTNNQWTSMKGSIIIGSMVPEEIPLGCTTTCTSAIPAFFVGAVTVTPGSWWTNDDGSGGYNSQTITSTILIESPYLNPWGNPISMVSTETPTPAIVIVTGYSSATIDWKGTTVTGAMTGTLGSSKVSGILTLSSSEHEDLVAGTASDNGTMTFSNMSPASLNAAGKYVGQSVIPKPGSPACSAETATFSAPCTFDCTSTLAALGLPAIPGTCTGTSFASGGQLSLNGANDGDEGPLGGDQVSISGAYTTIWTAPALGVIAGATATVTQPADGSD